MTRVIISADFSAGAPGFIAAVSAMLSGMGMELLTSEGPQVTAIVARAIEVAPAMDHPGPATVPAEEPIEIVAVADDVAVELPPVPLVTGVVNIKTLGVSGPYLLDPTTTSSKLAVQNIVATGDFMAFNVGQAEFKVPIERPEAQNVIANMNPQYTNTSIRVIIQINDSPDTQPVMLELIAGDATGVVIGQDLAQLVTPTEVVTNDPVPAQ